MTSSPPRRQKAAAGAAKTARPSTTQTPSEREHPKSARPRAKGSKATPPSKEGALVLSWSLHELPSSQHKAGLAGLALWLRYLKRSQLEQGTCELQELTEGALTLKVDRAGMQALFDRVYFAHQEQVERDKKLQKKLADGRKVDAEFLHEVTRPVTDKKGATKDKTFYIYEQTVPRGELIADWDESPTKLWLKLWRDMVWSILRGVPATREPYDARAEKRPCDDGGEAWDELAHNAEQGAELPSTYYLGAQAKSAENVSFRDRMRYRFLLHFWPFAVPIYVPAVLDREGKRDFSGFVLAVPDITDLEDFVESWDGFMRRRGQEVSGYRPRDAVVDVAAESALDVSARVFDLIEKRSISTAPWIGSVDTYHLEKDGNNVRLRSISRVELRRELVGPYRHARTSFWSPQFRRQAILNILEDEPWWRGFGRLCSVIPEEQTIRDKNFRHDCREAFTQERIMTDSEPEKATSLEAIVFKIARAYVLGRLKSKYDLDWTNASKSEDGKSSYNDKKDKIAREAFLSVRSRTGADFVAYFTGTLCSINQRIGQDGYLTMAQALRDEARLEQIRSLTLLALSAV